ncbi:AAA family ATPase [Candidatus Synechococcus spongiarum]|uniref:DNA repair protein RecN n=1 Tax=Candidatus Synechococcus spongiarum TaxID=431041 RepID=A0A165B1I3_9SYNE|nr:DNA repair protein RecN [Candidatus Synechococcus spongiarum]
MLLALKLDNVALIDALDLALAPGLTVLTGETGAGKSLLLDSLDVLLGGDVPKHLLRHESQRPGERGLEATFPSICCATARIRPALKGTLSPIRPLFSCWRSGALGGWSISRPRWW